MAKWSVRGSGWWLAAVALPLMPAAAASDAGSEAPYAAPAPGDYRVDPRHTTVAFSVRQFAIAHLTGRFEQPSGGLLIAPVPGNRARIDIRFPIAALTTGKPSADGFLKSARMFDAGHFPEAHFVGADIPTDRQTIPMTGMLTLHGVTRPVALTARLASAHRDPATGRTSLHFLADGSIRRSAFGMGFGRPFVSDQVDLSMDATFDAG